MHYTVFQTIIYEYSVTLNNQTPTKHGATFESQNHCFHSNLIKALKCWMSNGF